MADLRDRIAELINQYTLSDRKQGERVLQQMAPEERDRIYGAQNEFWKRQLQAQMPQSLQQYTGREAKMPTVVESATTRPMIQPNPIDPRRASLGNAEYPLRSLDNMKGTSYNYGEPQRDWPPPSPSVKPGDLDAIGQYLENEKPDTWPPAQ